MSVWVVERRRVERRGSLEQGTAPSYFWEREPGMPEFGSRHEAAVAITKALYPELTSSPEEFVLRHWRQWQRNVRLHRVRRIVETPMKHRTREQVSEALQKSAEDRRCQSCLRKSALRHRAQHVDIRSNTGEVVGVGTKFVRKCRFCGHETD